VLIQAAYTYLHFKPFQISVDFETPFFASHRKLDLDMVTVELLAISYILIRNNVNVNVNIFVKYV